MGAGASVPADELSKPLDASDVATPRGETAVAEVVRLRALLKATAAADEDAGAGGAVDAGAAVDAPAAADAGGAAEWKAEYCVACRLDCKDVPRASELACADARAQVNEEKGAPRMAIFGTAPDAADKVYWLASFEDKSSYFEEHKERESNKVFSKEIMVTYKHMPESEAPTKEEMMAAGMQDMAGSFMGPCWHLERRGASQDGTTYSVWSTYTCKSAEAAQALIAATKEDGLKGIAEEGEGGHLRCTILPPAAVGIEGKGAGDWPGPKDDVTVQVLSSWAAQADYAASREKSAAAMEEVRVKEMVNDVAADYVVKEFANTQHFAKPQ